MDNELKVQFRIAQDKLAGDVQRVTDTIQRRASNAFRGAQGGTLVDPTDAVMGILGLKRRPANYRLNFDRIRQAQIAPFTEQMRGLGMAQITKNFAKNGPALPALPPFMQNPDFFKEKKKDTSVTDAARTSFAALALKITAVIGTLNLMNRTFREFTGSVENARQFYAKSLTSGLALGQTTRRTLLANIIGVSETDIYRFGAALAYLNPKIEWASRQYTQTTIPLTELSYKFKILQENLKASAGAILTHFAPAIGNLIDRVANKVESATNSIVKSMEKWDAAAAFVAKNKGFTINRSYAPGQSPFETPSQYSFGFQGIQLQGKQADLVAKMFEKFQKGFNPNQSNLPQPVSFMKQLGASSLERMGLIAGPGSYAKDPSLRTAQNTKKISDQMQQLINMLKKGSSAINVFETAVSFL